MSKLRKTLVFIAILIILVVTSGIVAVATRPDFLLKPLIHNFNEQSVLDNGYTIKIGQIEGSFFSEIQFHDVFIAHDGQSCAKFNEISTKSNFLSLIIGENLITSATVDSAEFWIENLKKPEKSHGSNSWNLILHEIELLNGIAHLPDSSFLETVQFSFLGSVEMQRDTINVICRESFGKSFHDEFIFEDLVFSIQSQQNVIDIQGFSATSNFGDFSFDIQFVENSIQQLNGNIENCYLASFEEFLPSWLDKSYFAESKFEYTESTGNFNLSLKNHEAPEIKINGTLEHADNVLSFPKFNIQTDHSDISGSFYQKAKSCLILECSPLTPHDFGISSPVNFIEGTFSIFAENIHSLANLDIQSEMETISLPQVDLQNVHAKISRKNTRWVIEEPVTGQIWDGAFLLTGETDLQSVDSLSLTFQNIQVENLPNLPENMNLSGKSSGSVIANGDLKNLIIYGNISLDNISAWGDSIWQMQVEIDEIDFGKKRAAIWTECSNFTFRGIPFSRGEAEIWWDDGKLTFPESIFLGRNDTIFASGQYLDNTLIVKQLQGNFKEHRFSLLYPAILKKTDGWNINESYLQLDGGHIQTIQDSAGCFSFTFSEFDTKILEDWLNWNLFFAGIISGDIGINFHTMASTGSFNGHNIRIWNTPYQNFHGNFTTDSNQIEIQDLHLYNADETVSANGSWQWHPGKQSQMTDAQNLLCSFSNCDLKRYEEYFALPHPIAGNINADVAITGYRISPEIDFNFDIENGKYDLIPFYEIAGSGFYKDQKVVFGDILGETEFGTASGKGHIPINLSLWEIEERWLGEQSIDFSCDLDGNNMAFLTNYLDDVISISGDIQSQIGIAGTPNEPIRNGYVQIQNGEIILETIENPITEFSISGNLSDNLFSINHCTALMNNDLEYSSIKKITNWFHKIYRRLFKKRQETDYISNSLEVTGTLNMDQFFLPEYDLQLRGENLYFRTPLAKIEGISNANLQILGRDTIRVTGDLTPLETWIRYEFEEETESTESKTIPIEYLIHAPIDARLFFQNSQIESELFGDIWLVQAPNENLQFSGNLEIKEGKYFFYGDQFEIRSGSILFDPLTFDPKLDVTAYTLIGNDTISVHLSGKIESPTLELFSSSGYSETDIFNLLTFNINPDDDFSLNQNISENVKQIGSAYFERALENYGTKLGGFDKFDIQSVSGNQSLMNTDSLAVILGRRITPQMSLTYRRMLNLENAAQQFGIQYRLSPKSAIVYEVDENGLWRVHYRWRFSY